VQCQAECIHQETTKGKQMTQHTMNLLLGFGFGWAVRGLFYTVKSYFENKKLNKDFEKALEEYK
jgi:hypothetical protein